MRTRALMVVGAMLLTTGIAHAQPPRTMYAQALTRDRVDFSGKHYRFADVPIDLAPLQRPHPPLWYAVPVPEGAAWSAYARNLFPAVSKNAQL